LRYDVPPPGIVGSAATWSVKENGPPVAQHEDVSTVICAPAYGEVLGLTTEVVLGPEDGLPRTCAVRCDFLTLMFKSKLTHFVSTLSRAKLAELNRALAHAFELPFGTSAVYR